MEDRTQTFATRSVFREPSYVRFWIVRICSTVSFQMTAVAVGWQIYALTHSTFALGMVGLAQFLPMLCLTLLVGHVADRFNRKTILSICQAAEGATLAVLQFAASSTGSIPSSSTRPLQRSASSSDREHFLQSIAGQGSPVHRPPRFGLACPLSFELLPQYGSVAIGRFAILLVLSR